MVGLLLVAARTEVRAATRTATNLSRLLEGGFLGLLLFGGSRLAGIGKNAGRAIREFKEETSALRSSASPSEPPATPGQPASPVTPESGTDKS